MKKTMILMAACLVAGTAAAQDSPVDDWGANWFLSAKGGVSAFIGKPVGHGDLFDREKPLGQVVHASCGWPTGFSGSATEGCQYGIM